jgi:hypothetical protein
MVFLVQKAYLAGYLRVTPILKNGLSGQSAKPDGCGKKLHQGISKAFNYGSGTSRVGHITPKVESCHIYD